MFDHSDFNPALDLKYRICVMVNASCYVQQLVQDEWVTVAHLKDENDARAFIKSRQLRKIIEVDNEIL